MKNTNVPLHLMFFSTLAVMMIWLASPSVRANISGSKFPFADYEAHYDISWRGFNAGKSVHKLHRRTDGKYHFETQTHPNVKFLPFHYVESTDFIWQSNKIVPHNYYYNLKEGSRHKKGNVFFDWQNHKVANTVSHEPWEAKTQTGIQDKLTHAFMLRHHLKQGNTDLTYTVAEDDEVKTYAFTILGTERLLTAIGPLDTLKVEHVSRKGRRTNMWLAKKYDYLPVKINQIREGKIVGTGEITAFRYTNNKDNAKYLN